MDRVDLFFRQHVIVSSMVMIVGLCLCAILGRSDSHSAHGLIMLLGSASGALGACDDIDYLLFTVHPAYLASAMALVIGATSA